MREEVRTIVNRYGKDRAFLVSILQDIQARYNYLPKDILLEVAEELHISPSLIFSVATFYKAFSLTPRGKHIVSVCVGTACHVRGAPKILDTLERTLEIKPGQTTKNNQFTLETVNCVGACAVGPIIIMDGEYHGQMTLSKAGSVIGSVKAKEETCS
ncbi:MAG: NAD(P)H-dependent oxidoreductase subunit E [Proteobacteria bacterium]|nr:NAD(P)H-dependent oxidoreductase subunit E [Pseudomonadota bacterium]